MEDAKCKICRRLGVKLFLKGEKCLSPKCPMVRKPYPPGMAGKKRKRGMTEYGKELKEKQKVKRWYNLREKQFKGYVKEILRKHRGAKDVDIALLLMKKLESRLDNVVFRLGFASSRRQARQLVNHGHFTVNGRKVNIPSYELKKGDRVALREGWSSKSAFKDLPTILKKHSLSPWLGFDIKKMEGQIIGDPSGETPPPAEISSIFEFYSR